MTLKTKIDKLIQIYKIKSVPFKFDYDKDSRIVFWYKYDPIEGKIKEVKGKHQQVIVKIGQRRASRKVITLDPSKPKHAERINIIYLKTENKILNGNFSDEYMKIIKKEAK